MTEDSTARNISRRYNIGSKIYPLRGKGSIAFEILDTLQGFSPGKYYVRRVTKSGSSNVGGVYNNGWITADISQLGCYEVGIDTFPPTLKPVNEKKWSRSGVITFAMGDRGRGVKEFKGLIDGAFVLFEYSSKSGRITCNMRREKVRHGLHTLQLTVTDNAGNTTVVEKKIRY